MGWIRHHVIVVTYWNEPTILEIYGVALGIFGRRYVSEVSLMGINGHRSFFIPPDGSKESWPSSDDADLKRDQFIEYLRKTPAAWVEVEYGETEPTVTKHHREG
jgi:hypothetical protein